MGTHRNFGWGGGGNPKKRTSIKTKKTPTGEKLAKKATNMVKRGMGWVVRGGGGGVTLVPPILSIK